MGKFVKEIRIEKEFDGDTVVLTAKPVTIADMLNLKPPKENEERSPESLVEMISLFKKYVVNIVGVKDSDGAAVDKDVILESAYFMTLITDLATAWIERAMPIAKN